MTSKNDLPKPETVRSVTKRAAAVAKPLKRIMTINMKRYLMAVIVLWTSSYINAGTAPATCLGLPGFNTVQKYANYDVRTHHTNMDTYERVREADLRQAAVVMASFAYHASARKEKIPMAKSKSE